MHSCCMDGLEPEQMLFIFRCRCLGVRAAYLAQARTHTENSPGTHASSHELCTMNMYRVRVLSIRPVWLLGCVRLYELCGFYYHCPKDSTYISDSDDVSGPPGAFKITILSVVQCAQYDTSKGHIGYHIIS